MNTQVTFTPYEIIQLFLSMCATIVAVSAAVTVIIKVIQKAKQPEMTQNERIDALEKKVERFEQFFDNDNKRLIELEKGNRVTQQALLALLSHAIHGNDTDSLNSLTKAFNKLQSHLIGMEDEHHETS